MNSNRQINQNRYRFPALIIVCVLELVILFMYGFFTKYTGQDGITSLYYIFINVLAVLGFGLLLIYFRLGIMQTFIIAIVICAINVQLGPLFQQLWIDVFGNGFHQNPIPISLGFVSISSFCSISLLVVLTGIIGKIGILNTILTTIIFNIGFNLSYFLNLKINSGSNNSQIMDDFQGSRVFMFAVGFGIAMMLLYNRYSTIAKNQIADFTDLLSTLLSLIGTCFILAFFYFVFGFHNFASPYEYGLLNIYFGFSGSIVSSIAVACLLGGTITFHHINMTIISGALQVSILGDFIHNPFVSILAGFVGGVITSLLSHFAHQKLNSTQFNDSKGLITVYFVNCFICSYVICPIIISGYNKNLSTNYNVGYHMIYTTVSLFIGFLFGLIAGLFRRCIKEDIIASDNNFFNSKYLLPLNPRQKPQKSTIAIPQQQPSVQMVSVSKSRRERIRDPPEQAIFIQV